MTPTTAIGRHPLRGGSALLHSVDLRGPAGLLEAVVNEGNADAPFAALICHPHPKGGGNLHNKVVYHCMKALNAPERGLGWPVLRFNFRGTGRSEGAHDGHAEAEDVLAALRWLDNQFALPAVLVGFSFGAAMALSALKLGSHQVQAVAALGLPTTAEGRQFRYSFLKDLGVPKLFLSGDRDRYASPSELETVVAHAADPKRLIFMRGAAHFFAGRLESMQKALTHWLKEQLL